MILQWNSVFYRQVFYSVFGFAVNLGIVKKKLEKKTFISRGKMRLASHLPFKILLGGISLKSAKSLLCFHDK